MSQRAMDGGETNAHGWYFAGSQEGGAIMAMMIVRLCYEKTNKFKIAPVVTGLMKNVFLHNVE